ncbi:MAG: AIR synthase related protein, partial [Cocleimonas sp.]
MSEFNIIETYFTWDNPSSSVIQGVGDDAALLNVPSDKYLVASVDTSISGVHFPENTPAFDIAYKALAVNLSDLAAMGASAEWFTLALTLPSGDKPEDKQWLKDFSLGLKTLSQKTACALV